VFSRNVIAFFLLAALANIPAFVMSLASRFLVAPSVVFSFIGWLIILEKFVFWMVANGAITYGVVQDLRDGTVSIAPAIAIAARRFLPLIGVGISIFLAGSGLFPIILIGVSISDDFQFLIYPAIIITIIVSCMYYVAAPVCIAEQVGVRASLSRSRFLTKGHRLQILGAITLIVVVDAIADSAIAVVFGLNGEGTWPPALIVSFVLEAFSAAFSAVVAAVFYYELRVAKDGVDIDKIASVFD
jgi:hypothetical protein